MVGQVQQRNYSTKPNIIDKIRSKLNIKNDNFKKFLSELFGTFLLVFIGTSVCAQFILSNPGNVEHLQIKHTWIQITIGWGLALAFSVYATYRISGGHLNPAVSFAMLTLGKINPIIFIVYCIAQFIGAFIGAACTYLVHWDKISSLGPNTYLYNNLHVIKDLSTDTVIRSIEIPNSISTAGIFTSFLAPHLSFFGAFVDQFFGSAILISCICIIIEGRNRIPSSTQPLLIGLSLVMIGCAFGYNLGYPINPARDFGPRLFAWIVGYENVFGQGDYYFWIPIIAPFLGAFFGAWIYYLFVGLYLPEQERYVEVPMTIVKSVKTIQSEDTLPLTSA
ncbi:Major intrinsic protein family and Aquaporin-like domain-containing protein [Strongyloides ratti]|uniref:Major intrinsic protein family and Aquaporin-like domain-containing protein n=1 Tax=Strongyloides ratti TaxID=34506 RepID=A0A090MS64_STRRB|nr:Major intrinsic protein family and Aquaporin-like domain-containing protein [Strongyloides ratti]CEF61093.1 Major intrinsic protein family and Aquaporin-like domain-containing protein [Strongyloides ratti]